MLDVNTATARLVREMRETETAIGEALVRSTGLLHSAALAQHQVGGASAAQAKAVLLRMTKLSTDLIEAQGEAQRAHGGLLKIGHEMGAMEEPTCPDGYSFTGAFNEADIAA